MAGSADPCIIVIGMQHKSPPSELRILHHSRLSTHDSGGIEFCFISFI